MPGEERGSRGVMGGEYRAWWETNDAERFRFHVAQELTRLGERLRVIEERLAEIEREQQRDHHVEQEILQRLVALEATLQTTSRLLKLLLPIVITSVGLLLSTLFWIVERLSF
ncbi:MAG: hypothetical protein NZ761_10940 [Dehalococcoidia bacterium]|nr:hypothetical protein [Dehalococcoidia bacterium]